MVLAFFTSYAYASSGPAASSNASAPLVAETSAAAGTACACCAGSSGPTVERATVRSGDVQRIEVDVTGAAFVPDRIIAVAGVPIEIVFGRGSGCLAEVVFPDLDVRRDLTAGGAVVRLPALPASEHRFSCGMGMVFGTLVLR